MPSCAARLRLINPGLRGEAIGLIICASSQRMYRETFLPLFTLPTELAVGFFDRQVVDAGKAAFHVTEFVKFPILVAVGAMPLARIVMPFIFEANGNAIVPEGPEFLFQAIIQLVIPFPAQELYYLGSSIQEFGTVSPFG